MLGPCRLSHTLRLLSPHDRPREGWNASLSMHEEREAQRGEVMELRPHSYEWLKPASEPKSSDVRADSVLSMLLPWCRVQEGCQ